MKILSIILSIAFITILKTGHVCAQEPVPKQTTEIELLKTQMREMQAALGRMQTQHQQEIDALKAQIENQPKTVAAIQKSGAPPWPAKAGPTPAGTTLFPTTDEAVVAGAPPVAPAAGGAARVFPTTDAAVAGASPLTGPITLAGGGKTYLNISFDGMFAAAASTAKHLDALEVGDHDPQQRGFNARNTELALDGAVDPYFEGFANIVFKLDNGNETSVEVEEAFLQTTTLPWNLQLKGGQFFTVFGRNNPQHPHVWDFADAPLVNGRLLGSDGLRGVGAQISWVAPLPWYAQLSLAIQNGNGNTGFSFRNRGGDGTFYGRTTFDRLLRGPQDLVFAPRLETSFDLSPTQTLVAGVSGAFGPNDTGATAKTQIYGADVFYKWKPTNAEGGWPFVKWQSEAMLRRFEAGRGVDDAFPVRETFNDWGVYSQVVWGFHKGWSAGVRGDFLHMENSAFTDDPERQSRWRISADLTYFPSEFSKLRLQYNHDILKANDFLGGSSADSVFLQFEFALGAHAAHKF